MSNAQPEPSMEEILASIRRIISEDEEDNLGVDRSSLDQPDAPAKPGKQAGNDKPADTASEAQREAQGGDSSLSEMLDRVEAQHAAGQARNAGVFTGAEVSPSDMIDAEIVSAGDDESDDGVDAGNSDMAPDDDAKNEDSAKNVISTEDVKMVKQQAALRSETEEPIIDEDTANSATAAFASLTRSVRVADDEGQTLEAIVTEMLRPMIKDWLDTNLSRIVEEKVEYEVQRLARR